MSTRRIVITGVGMLTSLALNTTDTWSKILAGKSGVKNISSFDTGKIACKIASEIPEFNPENYINPGDVRKMDRFIHFGIAAAIEAVEDSNILPQTDYQKDRTGVMLGSGIGGLNMIEKTSVEFHNSTRGKVSPYFIPASLVNLLSGHVSIKYGFSGPNSAVSTACSTGAHAIGDAARMIKYGDADIMIAGGSEAPITPTGVAGFVSARALATSFNDKPAEASRPWDIDHDGFVMGEGAGVVVLEEYEHAKARGAKIYAEIIGYGLTGDAYHITSPNGRGAYRAMENALKDGKLNPTQIDYINAHGTSTKMGDGIELNAVQTLFADNKNFSMSSTKSSIGHLLGAAGSVEAIFTALALRDQIAPPTINLHNPIEGVEIDLIPLKAKKREINYALSNSFGFGGTNASLLLKRI
ncbi:MAG: beta-ketoacyl-ACP synthase II [Rickettsiaceae bacterium]